MLELSLIVVKATGKSWREEGERDEAKEMRPGTNSSVAESVQILLLEAEIMPDFMQESDTNLLYQLLFGVADAAEHVAIQADLVRRTPVVVRTLGQRNALVESQQCGLVEVIRVDLDDDLIELIEKLRRDAVDGLIEVDIDRMRPKKRQRYLGEKPCEAMA